MQCVICGKPITVKRTFLNLDKRIDHRVCKNCFQSHVNYFPYFVIPINGGLLHVFELIKGQFDPVDLFADYFRPYLQAYLKLDGYIDAIYLDILNQKWIDLFDKLNVGHLIIFTNFFKEE